MDDLEIDETLEAAKKFLEENRENENPPMLKGKFRVIYDTVIPLDEQAERELSNTFSKLKSTL
jgi:hypothetical protein